MSIKYIRSHGGSLGSTQGPKPFDGKKTLHSAFNPGLTKRLEMIERIEKLAMSEAAAIGEASSVPIQLSRKSSDEKSGSTRTSPTVSPAAPSSPRSEVPVDVQPPPDPHANLYIAKIPPNWDETQFREAFAQFGNIKSITLWKHLDGKPGHKGFGFCEYTEISDAAQAIEAMNGRIPDGWTMPLIVKYADTDPPRSKGRGNRGRGGGRGRRMNGRGRGRGRNREPFNPSPNAFGNGYGQPPNGFGFNGYNQQIVPPSPTYPNQGFYYPQQQVYSWPMGMSGGNSPGGYQQPIPPMQPSRPAMPSRLGTIDEKRLSNGSGPIAKLLSRTRRGSLSCRDWKPRFHAGSREFVPALSRSRTVSSGPRSRTGSSLQRQFREPPAPHTPTFGSYPTTPTYSYTPTHTFPGSPATTPTANGMNGNLPPIQAGALVGAPYQVSNGYALPLSLPPNAIAAGGASPHDGVVPGTAVQTAIPTVQLAPVVNQTPTTTSIASLSDLIIKESDFQRARRRAARKASNASGGRKVSPSSESLSLSSSEFKIEAVLKDLERLAGDCKAEVSSPSVSPSPVSQPEVSDASTVLTEFKVPSIPEVPKRLSWADIE